MESHSPPVRKFPDYMGCGQNPEIIAQMDTNEGEKVIFSCIVKKFNRFNMKQERTMLLTNTNLYNLKASQVQRRINISSIKAATKSTR